MALFVAFGSFCSYLLEHPVRVIFVFILVLLILAFICEFPNLDLPPPSHSLPQVISIPDASITSVLHDSVIKLVRDVKALGETYKRIRVAVDTGDRATVDTILKDPGHLRLVNLSWRVHPSPLVEAPRMGKTSVERDTLLVPVLAYEFFIHPVYCAWELARGV
ncbi:hypothetical protein FB45DRAFT_949391 [Roridomyces roridus]|uniref:Uncharacterized protein n=1 Tax=Roridomyces roridus TaxID=1738132 RepID=A0AAD7B1B0_9AGAR|nr:hypothetical protein FB45DRAFT_949391 [Roridomyces roridus]